MASQSGTRYEDRTMQRPGTGNTTGTAGGQGSSQGAGSSHMNNSAGGYSVRVCIIIYRVRKFSMVVLIINVLCETL